MCIIIALYHFSHCGCILINIYLSVSLFIYAAICAGVTVVIPAGAIPDGVQQEVYFKVCQDNSILPPLDKDKGKLYTIYSCQVTEFICVDCEAIQNTVLCCAKASFKCCAKANCLMYFFSLYCECNVM